MQSSACAGEFHRELAGDVQCQDLLFLACDAGDEAWVQSAAARAMARPQARIDVRVNAACIARAAEARVNLLARISTPTKDTP